jgi:hypothetical protein
LKERRKDGNGDAIMFLALLLHACTPKQDRPKEGLKEETHKPTETN